MISGILKQLARDALDIHKALDRAATLDDEDREEALMGIENMTTRLDAGVTHAMERGFGKADE